MTVQQLAATDFLNLIGSVLAAAIVVLLPVELWLLHRQGRLDAARIKEMLASTSPLLPTLLLGGAVTAFFVAVFDIAAELSPWRVPVNWISAAIALLVVDFLYYWDHRAAHQNRTYWALAHSVHHSSGQFDQTTALRVSVMDGLFSPWFYLPPVLAGFDPALIGACFLLILGYQQWIHTETVGKLPWFDGWLNTPSNHRVHHGMQWRYQDCNFGAILIVWDRLFGTWVRETEPVRYGLTESINTSNPLMVHVFEARRLWNDLRRTPGWPDRLRRLWHKPDWRPPAIG
jgi:sterol desaturase/sphingolipid hydroxylase (fatty acid hydroxylase superfamily)